MGSIGILVAERWVESMLEVRRVDARIIVLKLQIGKCLVFVVAAHASQIELSKDVKGIFWDELLQVVSELGERECLAE